MTFAQCHHSRGRLFQTPFAVHSGVCWRAGAAREGRVLLVVQQHLAFPPRLPATTWLLPCIPVILRANIVLYLPGICIVMRRDCAFCAGGQAGRCPFSGFVGAYHGANVLASRVGNGGGGVGVRTTKGRRSFLW